MDFGLREEYYFKLRFLPEARPVMTTVIEGVEYPIGWVYARRGLEGGRSFGFVGGHFHDNFGIKAFRQAIVNGILWTAHIEVPANGAPIAHHRSGHGATAGSAAAPSMSVANGRRLTDVHGHGIEEILV